jgi:hypothetical protein
MKFNGGPFNGRDNEAQQDEFRPATMEPPARVGAYRRVVNAPTRMHIEDEMSSHWYTVSNYYVVQEDGVTAVYDYSEFKYK